MTIETARLIISSLVLLSILLSFNAFARDVQRWTLPEGAIMRLGKGEISQIVYSPEGSRLAVASSIGIWLYDGSDGVELDLFTGHSHKLYAIAFSPNGDLLASGGGGEIRLWDAHTGELKRILDGSFNR